MTQVSSSCHSDYRLALRKRGKLEAEGLLVIPNEFHPAVFLIDLVALKFNWSMFRFRKVITCYPQVRIIRGK